MSSLRPAKIAAALVQLIGVSLADPEAPTGPTCSCEKCDEAWQRNRSAGRQRTRSRRTPSLLGT